MKNWLSLFFLLLIALISGCKKNYPDIIQPVASPVEKMYRVTTVAGEGSPSFLNGPAISATFHFPEDVVVAPDGIMYVTDVLNFCIRKIEKGVVSTFAGGNGFDIENGKGGSAKFKNPYSITMDRNGNLYTTDDNDPRIRKITPAADVTTYAGIETPGFSDGKTDVAQFKPGSSIVSDAAGNLYVSDGGNHRIRKISVTGEVTTLAGSGVPGFNDGAGNVAQFSYPGRITIDKNGNLYVTDRNNFRIRKITPAGYVSTVAGNGSQGDNDGQAIVEARFGTDMLGITVDSKNNIYIGNGYRIRKVTPEGVVSTIAGSSSGYSDGNGNLSKFNFPAGLGIDLQDKIYVADLVNNRIRKISFE